MIKQEVRIERNRKKDNMNNTIKEILQDAKNNKWPYPKTFEMLKDAGVEEYDVQFIEKFDAHYKGDFGVLQEPTPVGYIVPLHVGNFSQEAIKTALKNHIAGKRNYVEFLLDMADAGVTHYKVSMKDRTVTYYGENVNNFHQEIVPQWKEV